MRLLFSSSHRGLVEQMGKRLAQAGVSCEVRYRPVLSANPNSSDYKELWIQMDNSAQWACSLLAMHCAVGRN
jgi:hypothetical protein